MDHVLAARALRGPHAAALRPDLEEHFRDDRVELRAGCSGATSSSARSVVSAVRYGRGDVIASNASATASSARLDRDRLARETRRVAGSVPALVVEEDVRQRVAAPRAATGSSDAPARGCARISDSSSRGQRPRLAQHRRGGRRSCRCRAAARRTAASTRRCGVPAELRATGSASAATRAPCPCVWSRSSSARRSPPACPEFVPRPAAISFAAIRACVRGGAARRWNARQTTASATITATPIAASRWTRRRPRRRGSTRRARRRAPRRSRRRAFQTRNRQPRHPPDARPSSRASRAGSATKRPRKTAFDAVPIEERVRPLDARAA